MCNKKREEEKRERDAVQREGKKRVACGSKSRIISNDLAFQILEKLRLASQRSGHQPMGSHQSYVAVLVPD